jgi:tetratricopeptide (TPR) repeat protein
LAYTNRGWAYDALGQLQRAIEDYNEAIRLNPEKASLAYANRGLAYANLGQLQRAIADFDEAIRLDPGLAQAYASSAFAHTLLNDDEAAQQDVEWAIELGYDERLLNAAIVEAKRSQ